MSASAINTLREPESIDARVQALLEQMTISEKIGQMCQVNASEHDAPHHLADALRAGRVGSVLNNVDVHAINELQRIATEESRLGIPLLVGRDVIHGFSSVSPIPLGQSSSWNPDIVRESARVAALEASRVGINWTFAPMIDIARDARWGRIAESLGEDPYLASVLGVAMVEGFQGEDLSAPGTIAACAKHFVGYGESESGRDYATTNIPENELRNVHMRPFKAAVDAGVASIMTSFGDLDGVPASANEFLLRQVLRDEWDFDGLVVSDWDSIWQLQVHGLTDGDKGSALAAVSAGVDMEMASQTYSHHLEALIKEGLVEIEQIDTAVKNILRTKIRLGLFEQPYTKEQPLPLRARKQILDSTRRAALQSAVLLKNDHAVLPLNADELRSVAVIGPLADAPYEQLGTWIFDGDVDLSVTPRASIQSMLEGRASVTFEPAFATSRGRMNPGVDRAVEIAESADVAILFLGEESILSGEAHSRADISLPGDQAELVRRVRATGTPTVAVIMAGRPLTLSNVVDELDAILFAWHPGSMAGPAIADLLFGVESPSGKLTTSFPKMVGQIPIYYNQKNTGKPPTPEQIVHIDDIDPRAPQTSIGMTAFHLDAGYTPLFPFGYGLSYSRFEYHDIQVSRHEVPMNEIVEISATLVNAGDVEAVEVAQLYVRDVVANVTRPVRELKGFRRVRLKPGEATRLSFELNKDDLSFFDRHMQKTTEPGEFHVWIGGDSNASLQAAFRLLEDRQKT